VFGSLTRPPSPPPLACTRSYVDDGKDAPSDIDRQKSKEFWLELANQRLLAGLRGGGDDAAGAQANDAASYTIDGMPARQPGEPFSEVAAKLLVSAARERLEEAGVFREIDARTQRTLQRVLKAFREKRVGPHLFGGTDGYGHGDYGRETLDEIYAQLFGAEAALIRIQCFSGTHAIACALFAVLRPGHEMLAISGKPYDTLEEVIGSRKEDPELEPDGMTGSLDDFGVTYKEIALLEDGAFDLEKIDEALKNPNTRLVHIQRSCGYQWRPSIPVHKIGEVIAFVKERREDVVVFGEFVASRLRA
jgi:cystathionine beta-lyase family protein involved in aluminum resistance